MFWQHNKSAVKTFSFTRFLLFSPSVDNRQRKEFVLSPCVLLSVYNENRKVEPMCLIAKQIYATVFRAFTVWTRVNSGAMISWNLSLRCKKKGTHPCGHSRWTTKCVAIKAYSSIMFILSHAEDFGGITYENLRGVNFWRRSFSPYYFKT